MASSDDFGRDDDEGYQPCHPTPFVQIFSVEISFKKSTPYQVYGSILVSEGPDRCFWLYDRGPESPDYIHNSGQLSIVGPQGKPITPSKNTTLVFSLKGNADDDVVVVEGQLILDALNENSFDRFLTGKVQCEWCNVHVHYVVFQFAVYGIVKVIVTKTVNGDEENNAEDISGNVVASYENGRRFCSLDEDLGLLETSVFSRPWHEPLRVMLGKPTTLFRTVALPAYSGLTIKVNLRYSKGPIAIGSLQYPAYIIGHNPKYFRTDDVCVEVQVRWENAYVLPFDDLLKLHEKMGVLHIEGCSTSPLPRPIPSTKITSSYLGYGDLKAELFSIFVDGITEKISALCGDICIDDGSDDVFSIYQRDESCFDLSPDKGLVCLNVHRAICNSEFSIQLQLRDPVAKLEVSRGYCGWSGGALDTNMLYEKQLSSMVRGKHGYAVVHYEIFNSAFEAHVRMKLLSAGRLEVPRDDAPLRLFGTLNARYSGHDYSTSYKEKYFTSTLFSRPWNKALEVFEGRQIDMIKSVVVVPENSSLLIEANLVVVQINNNEQRVRGMAKFEIDLSTTTSAIIEGRCYSIEVSVEFKV